MPRESPPLRRLPVEVGGGSGGSLMLRERARGRRLAVGAGGGGGGGGPMPRESVLVESVRREGEFPPPHRGGVLLGPPHRGSFEPPPRSTGRVVRG
jgi:hypothetical protein